MKRISNIVALFLLFLTMASCGEDSLYPGFKKMDNGAYMKFYSKGNSEVMPLVVRSMHREMAGFAQKAIDEFETSERDVSGVTMGIDRDAYEQIVRELESCRRKIVAIANMSKEPCQVYRLNLQMFPLSKNTQKK